MFRSEIAVSYGNSISTFLRTLPTGFHSDYTNLQLIFNEVYTHLRYTYERLFFPK